MGMPPRSSTCRWLSVIWNMSGTMRTRTCSRSHWAMMLTILRWYIHGRVMMTSSIGQLLDKAREVGGLAQRLEAADVGAALVWIVVHKADDVIVQRRLGDDVAHHGAPHLAGADDQQPVHAQPLSPQLLAHHPLDQAADHQQDGDQDTGVEKDQARIEKGAEEEDDDKDHQDDAGRSAGHNAIDFVEPRGTARLIVDPAQLVDDQEQHRQASEMGINAW